MASSATQSHSQWEVVGKTKKAKPQALTKSQKKNFISSMPRIEKDAPLDPDETIYSLAFKEKEKHATTNGHGAAANTNQNKKPTVQKKKKPEEIKKKEKPLDADEAIAQIDHLELENILKQSQIRFPDNQDVWLKDLASFLNLKLERVKNVDPVFKGKPWGYPFNQLDNNCRAVLKSVVTKFSNQMLDHVFYHTIQTMLQEGAKDQPTIGYKLFLQLLAQHKPDIALGKVHQYLELLKTHQNRPPNCLAILWALGQCGLKNFKCGLKVWLDLMLPALEVKQVAHYPVDFLESLIATHKKMSNAYGVVTLKEYFKVMDIVFSPSFNLAADLRKRLAALYPNIRELAYGDTPSHNLRTFFPTYLNRLNSTTNKAIKNELLECLSECLVVDPQSYSVWCNLYTSHFTASGLLLEHINYSWDKLSVKLNKKLLRETVRSFIVTNEELEGQGKANKEGLALCAVACKEVESRMTQSSFPWGLLIFFLVTLVTSIVLYDIMTSASWRVSRTMRFLEHYKLLPLLEQAWGRCGTTVNMAVGWVRVNCPAYYSYVRDTVGPVLVMCWGNLQEFVIQAEVATRPHRELVKDKAWDAYVWVYELSPDTWVRLEEGVWLVVQVLTDYSLWLWKNSLLLAADVQHWLQQHVFTGSLSKESLQLALEAGLSKVQIYVASFWSWCDTNILSQFK